jgi:hypothetical protein
MKIHALFLLMAIFACGVLLAQETSPQTPAQTPAQPQGQPPGPPTASDGRGQGRGGPGGGGGQFRGTAGEITEISGDTITLKAINGGSVKVKTTADTRFRKDFQTEAKFSDFKVGDFILVRGEPSGENQFTAQGIMLRPAGMQGDRQVMMAGPGGPLNPADMGKTFIVGEVLKIDGTTLTIRRPDRQEQQIEVDENTSFRKQRESITLPDIKVGDTVMGRGALKDGTFVPATLNVVDPQMLQRMMQFQKGAAPAQQSPPAPK